ncbi:MAG: hypothetical protein QM736_02295 [Vicinamibacterales bacterium]
MANADALRHDAHDTASSGHVLESLGLAALFGVAAVTQFSIAAGEALAYIAIVCWGALLVARRERLEVPTFFYPLLAYAGWTLVSAAFSPNPRASFIDCKQLHAVPPRACHLSARARVAAKRDIDGPHVRRRGGGGRRHLPVTVCCTTTSWTSGRREHSGTT